MNDLDRRLEAIARVPVLLVATDYDGTLSPIVPNPAEARPNREAIVALRNLAALEQTHVAVISGRALADLASLAGLPDEVHLVGSHGSEFDPDFLESLSDPARSLRDDLRDRLTAIARAHSGFLVETKPASVAFHYRNAPDDVAVRALAEIEAGPGRAEGVHTRHGKKVVELAVMDTHKGQALEALRSRVGASAVVFLGDDRTDEDAFATLRGPDLGVKVGSGRTIATHRVSDTTEVARLIAHLSERRAAWLRNETADGIEEHAMLSDQRTAALVSPAGRVVWFCAPRLDSPALFAQIVGDPSSGSFAIAPAGDDPPRPTQRYLDRTMVLVSEWPSVRVTDFLDCSSTELSQRTGRVDLIRLVEGAGQVSVTFAPRLDYGRTATGIEVHEGGLIVQNAFDPIVLASPGVSWRVETEGRHQTARAEIELRDEPVVFELRYGTRSLRADVQKALQRRDRTARFWSSWSARLTLPRTHHELVERSALVLRALCHDPTGAIAAAATTSLPEHIGGIRNWDYRYCWLRDGAMAASSLVRLGSLTEAMRFLDWVLGVVDRTPSPERLRPLYTLVGGDLPPEAEIAELAGYRGSRPVRVSNAAAGQVQLDVFGPVLELIHLLLERDAPLFAEHWRLAEALVEAVAKRWQEPDHGIWEFRTTPRHYVHSKAMCWLAVDRGARLAELFAGRRRPDWEALRDAIASDVEANAWNEERGAYTIAYGSRDLDASVLLVGLTGLVPPDHPRFVATVHAIERELRRGPVVYRYDLDDGLPGVEGGFHICTSWLVEAYLAMGRRSDAEALMDRMCELAGPTGLMSEQYGSRSRRALGNHPQAFSHIGVVEAALRLG